MKLLIFSLQSLVILLIANPLSIAEGRLHPKSILDVTIEGDTRIYNFLSKKGTALPGNIACLFHTIPFPILVNDTLIIHESILRVCSPPFSFDRTDQVITSVSIANGDVIFAREIVQPESTANLMDSYEYMSCTIRGLYIWRNQIVVLLVYDDFKETYEKPHVYVIDQYGKLVSSFKLDGYGFRGFGVDEKNDRLILADNLTIYLGGPCLKEMIGEIPQILQMDLHTGEIVSRNDFYTCLGTPMSPDGILYYFNQQTNDEELLKMEVFSLNPFQLISEKMIQHISHPSDLQYWNGLLWERIVLHPGYGLWSEDLRAYNPDTMERVEPEETPYHFIHKVDGIPYLIERINQFSEDGTESPSIRITNLQEDVSDWKKHD